MGTRLRKSGNRKPDVSLSPSYLWVTPWNGRGDIKTIQELMGHRDIKMTMRYSHPTAEHKRNAVEMLSGFADRVTSIFTTEAKSEKSAKVVKIGNH